MVARYRVIRSQRAIWSRRLALFAIPLLALAALLHRFGQIDFVVTLTVIAIAIVFSILALAFAVAAIVMIWSEGHKGLASALVGLVVSLAVLAIPGYAVVAIMEKPALNDIVTDTFDPPVFVAAASLRSGLPNASVYARENGAVQLEHYPEISPLILLLPADEVFRIIEGLVEDENWQLVDSQEPANGFGGRLEAVAQSRVFGFRDDVLIVAEPIGESLTRVQMRSASRNGRHDLGANAERIFMFLQKVLANATPIAAE